MKDKTEQELSTLAESAFGRLFAIAKEAHQRANDGGIPADIATTDRLMSRLYDAHAAALDVHELVMSGQKVGGK